MQKKGTSTKSNIPSRLAKIRGPPPGLADLRSFVTATRTTAATSFRCPPRCNNAAWWMMGGRMVDNPSKSSAHPGLFSCVENTFFPLKFSRQNPRGFCIALALMAVGRCQEKRDELCVHPPQLLRLPSSRACPAARPVVTPVLGTPRFPSGVGFQVASARVRPSTRISPTSCPPAAAARLM